MDKKKPTLVKLTIEVAGEKYVLTKEDAQELHKVLSELFGEKITYVDRYRDWSWPYQWTLPRQSPRVTYTNSPCSSSNSTQSFPGNSNISYTSNSLKVTPTFSM